MKKKILYTNEPLEMAVVRDFLPPPDKLVLKEETQKVTLSLSRRSVSFFKSQARQRHTRYQRMIRRLLDLYATRYQSR